MGRVAIVVGHNSKKRGAYSNFLEEFEFDYFKKIVEMLKEKDHGDQIDFYFRNFCGSYKNEMLKIIEELNKKKYKLIIELHFNSVDSKEVHGAEVLLFHSSKQGIKEAVRFLNSLRDEYKSKIRGLKPVTSSSQRGGMGICKTKATYILIEPFFGSNESDSKKFKDKEKFVNFLYKYIMEVE